MASRLPSSDPTLGMISACSSTRSSWHSVSAPRRDRQRRQHEHGRVAAQEELRHEVLDVEAHARVALAAVALREPGPPALPLAADRVDVVFEQVALHVEDELLPT